MSFRERLCIRKGLQIVLRNRRTCEIPERLKQIWIAQNIERRILKTRKVDGGLEYLLDMPLILVKSVEIVFQRFFETFGAKGRDCLFSFDL